MAIKVLLVEDNQDNQDLMRFLLERNGYEVVTALNGKQALVSARQEQPDVVLMDLTMPEMNGWEAAAAMKADPALANIPLIAVTAHTLPGDRRKTLGAGFDNYISKPINVRMFDHIVSQTFGKREIGE
ncbi:MAG TPA: response regulator [Anaerolineae bacterium]|jgi:CheY-like chemotaxis protein|nr:response regulator [Anaerolineae bacterium]HAE60093.1 response regulator [Anaerolineae bacterium]